ncbi:MAG: hypothetical protein U0802_18600 [Candidatus Binatia bacterium]
MELDVTVHFIPIFWGMVAVLLLLVGALLASVDPKTIEVHLGNPSLLLGTAAAMLMVGAALLVFRAGIAHGLGALLVH